MLVRGEGRGAGPPAGAGAAGRARGSQAARAAEHWPRRVRRDGEPQVDGGSVSGAVPMKRGGCAGARKHCCVAAANLAGCPAFCVATRVHSERAPLGRRQE